MSLLIPAVIFAVAFPVAYVRLKREQDSDWERRWRDRPLAERARLTAMARRGELPSDPEQAELVAGSARYQRSLGSSFRHASSARLVVASLLLLAAIVKGSPLLIGVTGALVGFLVWMRRREAVRNRNLRHAEGERP